MIFNVEFLAGCAMSTEAVRNWQLQPHAVHAAPLDRPRSLNRVTSSYIPQDAKRIQRYDKVDLN